MTQPLRFSLNDNHNMLIRFLRSHRKPLIISFWCPHKGQSHFNIHHWLITVWPRFPNIKREEGVVVCSTVTCRLFSKQMRNNEGESNVWSQTERGKYCGIPYYKSSHQRLKIWIHKPWPSIAFIDSGSQCGWCSHPKGLSCKAEAYVVWHCKL